MVTANRRNAVGPRLRAGDPAVSVIVVHRERVGVRGRTRSPAGSRRRLDLWWSGDHDQLERRAAGQNCIECRGFLGIYRQTVFSLYLNDASGIPAQVQVRQPLGGVLAALLVTVDARARECEVQQVGRKLPPRRIGGGAQAAVVGLGASYDMLDVGLPGAGEGASSVRSIDDAAHIRDYSRFYGLGVGIVVGIIRRAPVLRGDP